MNKKQLENWAEKNQKLFKEYNFKVYDVSLYMASKAESDFPMLTYEEIHDTFIWFCDTEFDFFKDNNNMELTQYIGRTSSFYVLPKHFYNWVDIRRGEVNMEDFWDFIQMEGIKTFRELDTYFEECFDFINNLLHFKENQVEIFKAYLIDEKEKHEEAKQEKLAKFIETTKHLKNITDAINLYIDIITPHDVEDYQGKIESMRKTLEEVKRWEAEGII